MPLLAMALLCVSGRYADEVSPEPVTIPASGFEWFSYLLGFPGWQGGPPAFLATVEEAEKEYNKVLESTTNMKEVERAEKNYFDSLKVLEKFNKLNGYKRN